MNTHRVHARLNSRPTNFLQSFPTAENTTFCIFFRTEKDVATAEHQKIIRVRGNAINYNFSQPLTVNHDRNCFYFEPNDLSSEV